MRVDAGDVWIFGDKADKSEFFFGGGVSMGDRWAEKRRGLVVVDTLEVGTLNRPFAPRGHEDLRTENCLVASRGS